MGNTKKEIDCIKRLQDKSGSIDEILDFLVAEKLMTLEEAKKVKHSSDEAKDLQALLRSLSMADKLQLLEYSWVILPIEIIKVYIVTNRDSREFTYNF